MRSVPIVAGRAHSRSKACFRGVVKRRLSRDGNIWRFVVADASHGRNVVGRPTSASANDSVESSSMVYSIVYIYIYCINRSAAPRRIDYIRYRAFTLHLAQRLILLLTCRYFTCVLAPAAHRVHVYTRDFRD